MCGASLPEAASYTVCSKCGAELKKSDLLEIDAPSEARPDVLLDEENKLISKDAFLSQFDTKSNNSQEVAIVSKLWELASDILPDPLSLEDPRAFFSSAVETSSYAYLDLPDKLDRYLDDGVRAAKEKLETIARLNGQSDLTIQQSYELAIRLLKWLESHATLFDSYIEKAATHLKGDPGDYRTPSQTPLEQATDGFEPEKMVAENLLEIRSGMLVRLNANVLWAGGQGSWGSWLKERYFHPRFVNYLLDNIESIKGVDLHEIRLLLMSLKDEGQNPVTSISSKTEFSDKNKGFSQYTMTKADRLLELLYHPNVIGQVARIFSERESSIPKEELPEWREYKQMSRNSDTRNHNAGWKQLEAESHGSEGWRSITKKIKNLLS
jgi:hypothetical protein